MVRTIGAMTHGIRSGYNWGCRCAACTEANTAASRERRQGRAARSRGQQDRKPLSARLVHEPTRAVSEDRGGSLLPTVSQVPARPESTAPLLLTGGILGIDGRQPVIRPAGSARPARRVTTVSSWDEYARLLKLYLAGVGPSPSLLALAAETEAYYSLAEDRSGHP